MSELYFRAGETEGFTSKKLADKKSGYANPIRELLQNSLDASKDAKNEKCEINIYIESIKKSDIPHIESYEDYLNQAVEFQKSVGSFGHNAKQTVAFMKEALKQDELDILMFVDNGIGISPNILNGLIGDRSVKSDESSGGSFGVGHLSSYFLSSLRYVLYASKYKDNGEVKNLFSGAPILAGFEDKQEIPRGSIGRILEKTPEDELKPKFIFPTIYPDFIADKMNDVDTGSMVAILGLNTEWKREANYAIVSNFFYAINKQELEINVDYGIVSNSINSSDIELMLSTSKDGKMATGDSILSGSDIYQLWLTVKDESLKQEISLDNGDKVCVHIRNNIETNSVIALVRNGMLISRHDKMLSNPINNLRKNEDFEPFSIVINVDDSDCSQLFSLVKGAENPYHNKLENGRLSPKDEKKLKDLLKELSEKIQNFLQEKDREGFDLAIPLLEIPNKAEVQGENNSRPKSQTPKAKPNKPTPKQPTGKVNKTGKGKKRPAPVIVNRVLESKNAVRFKDNGDTIDVIMRIKPHKIDLKDDVYFSVSLAMDTDNNSTDSALDLVKLSVNDKDTPIPKFVDIEKDGEIKQEPADQTQIKLGKASEEGVYNVIATVKKPEKVKNIGVALKPFLGLKQSNGGK
ncbi:hypothetical protein [uncultured Gammaproteobacteria bacterium]|uniref:hypothetical protein n=1 Tax=Bathymodiolus heckerae thiotrophic gill symbiont TaxID=1052212 RepID=UPI0010BABA57|nr:hypothetical protein [Bathymodiolus heckerae thiotrophic gill symbiont]CAC9546825.1 hypothetical protein [uncultured Gammaproteobacteria bacterium]CAC9606002.1 hypothetical protein [uncultured Gammaproteobacteria bacterium]SHN91265.1 hypothetical protein BHECKSOX_1492 [Bathymodiolus heckerae thiotrophic gill symbiont]